MNRQLKFSEQLIIFFIFFFFFLITLAQNFSGPHDSISYLIGIVSGNHLFHPHHLLYHFTARCWWQIAQRLFPNVRDYYLIEAFTAFCGAGCMVILYSFFRNRFKLPALISGFNTSVIAFSYGVWFYSTNIEVYASFIFFLLWTLYVITKEDFTKKDLWKVILLHCIAILFYQANILFTIVVLYKIWEQRRKISLSYSLPRYIVTGVLLVGMAYWGLGWVAEGENSMDKWLRWMGGYAITGDYWEPLGLSTISHTFIGFVHAFIGGHYIFNLPPIKAYMLKAISTHSLSDEIFLVRGLSSTMAVIITVLSLILGFLTIGLIVRFIRRFKTINREWNSVIPPILLSLVVYFLFFCVWDPEILEMWIFQTILVWLLLLGTITITGFELKIRPLTGVIVLSVLILTVNYFGSIKWLQNIQNDLYYVKTEPMKDVSEPKDLVLLQDGWILKDFMKYYGKAPVYDAMDADTSRMIVDKAISKTLVQGGKLYIYPEKPVTDRESKTYIDSLLNYYKDRKKIFKPDNPVIILIQ